MEGEWRWREERGGTTSPSSWAFSMRKVCGVGSRRRRPEWGDARGRAWRGLLSSGLDRSWRQHVGHDRCGNALPGKFPGTPWECSRGFALVGGGGCLRMLLDLGSSEYSLTGAIEQLNAVVCKLPDARPSGRPEKSKLGLSRVPQISALTIVRHTDFSNSEPSMQTSKSKTPSHGYPPFGLCRSIAIE